MPTPRIETKPPIRIIGMAGTFVSGLSPDTDAGDVIGPLWGTFIPRIGEIERLDETVCYGYSYCLPEAERDRPDRIGYVAGTPVAEGASVPAGMVATEMAGGLYAVFEHHGPIWTFDRTLRAIYHDWLPTSDYVGNGVGDVELYDERWSMDGEDSVLEYWVGIRPRG